MTLIRLIIALTLTMIVPAGGYFLSGQIMGEIDAGLIADGFPPFRILCAMPEAGSDGDLFAFCAEMKGLRLLMTVSIVAGIFGIGIPLVFLLASILAGKDRRRLSMIFPITVHATLVFVTISAAMQGAVLTYGLFIAESYYLGRVHIYLIAVVGFGAAGVAYKLLMESLSFGARHENFIHAVSIGEDKAPGLHSFVTGLAEKLGARPPDNIVVGLDPTFFVTSADIRIPDSPRPLEGETLYVSLPLARLMSVSELAAVVGHELGHFRGKDTIYSLKFAPAYAGLAEALAATRYEKGEKLFWIAKLPARAMLSLTMNVFAMNKGALSRERELLADQAGAEASSPKALVTSLIKISAYSQLWDAIHRENIDRLNDGRTTRNLSSLLESRGRHDIETHTLDETSTWSRNTARRIPSTPTPR